MTFPTQPDVLGHLREKGARTTREIVDAYAEPSDDRKALEMQVQTFLIRLKRMGMVSMTREPEGRGRLWSVVPTEGEEESDGA